MARLLAWSVPTFLTRSYLGLAVSNAVGIASGLVSANVEHLLLTCRMHRFEDPGPARRDHRLAWARRRNTVVVLACWWASLMRLLARVIPQLRQYAALPTTLPRITNRRVPAGRHSQAGLHGERVTTGLGEL